MSTIEAANALGLATPDGTVAKARDGDNAITQNAVKVAELVRVLHDRVDLLADTLGTTPEAVAAALEAALEDPSSAAADVLAAAIGIDIDSRIDTHVAEQLLDPEGTIRTAILEAASAVVGKPVYLSHYCEGDGTDEAAQLRAAVQACLDTGATLVCDVLGSIGLGSTVTLGDTRANSQQRIILSMLGGLRVKATAAIERLLEVRGTIYTQACHIEADGASLANFSFYAVNFGRSKLGHLNLFGGKTSDWFIEPTGNNNLWSALTLRATGAGSALTTAATLTARSAESGWTSTGDNAPYSTWTLSNPLPDALTVNQWAAPLVRFADGRYMQVRRVVDATHIEVFNENRPLATTETITVRPAALNWAYYGDTGGWEIGQVDVRDNPTAAALAYGGYGGKIGVWYQQNNAAGVAILKKAHGLVIGQFYTELSGVWLIVRDSVNTALFIGPGTNGNPTDFQVMDQDWMGTNRAKRALHWIVFRPSGSPIEVPPAVPLDLPELNPGARNITPGTVQAYRRTSGNYALRIANTYTSGVGVVTLAAPATGAGTDVVFTLLSAPLGHTIEGGASLTVRVFGAATTFAFWLEPGTPPDWKVRAVGNPNDLATSIAAAPARIAQEAIVAGVFYKATGTASPADWKQITN